MSDIRLRQRAALFGFALLIEARGCESSTNDEWWCLKPGSGKHALAQYDADQMCDPCMAHFVLCEIWAADA